MTRTEMLDPSLVGDGVTGGVEDDFFFLDKMDCLFFLGVRIGSPEEVLVAFLKRFFICCFGVQIT
jgi:hypothetical protein